MDAFRKTVLLGSLLFLFISGCLGINQERRKIDYYTLEYDAPKAMELEALPFVIYVNRFHVAPLYNSNKIVYREKRFKTDAYVYHNWRANPGDIVTYLLARDMRQSSLFNGVFAGEGRHSSSHAVEGTVDEFFEEDSDTLWHATLSISITLLAENEPDISKRVLFQKGYSVREPCAHKNPRAVAEAMSRAMARISQLIRLDIYNHLAKEANVKKSGFEGSRGQGFK
ncbi:MAG: ABC-type transport auxiliary lipoprotein family protein [Pseudomonadota bacterium]